MRKQILRKSLALLCCDPKLQQRSISISISISSFIDNSSRHRCSYFHRFLAGRSLSSSPALDTDGRGPFSPKILRLSDEISALSDEEVALMSSTLRRKLGLPEPPPIGSMPIASPDWLQDGDSSSPDGAAAPAEKAAEKTSFCVKIEKFDASSKIKVIKEVRAATELGLKEAKEFVEKVPAVVKSGLSKEEAQQLMEKLKAAGATAVVE